MPFKILPLPPHSQMLATKKWRNFINSPNFSTSSNKNGQHAQLRHTSQNDSNATRSSGKSLNNNSMAQRAPTSLQYHRGRRRQSTSRLGPRKSTDRIRFTAATQLLNAALHPTRLCNISKGDAHPPQTRHTIYKYRTTTTVPNSKPHPPAKIHIIQVR